MVFRGKKSVAKGFLQAENTYMDSESSIVITHPMPYIFLHQTPLAEVSTVSYRIYKVGVTQGHNMDNLAYTEHYTVADFEQWIGDWELVQGHPLAMTPSPSPRHQIISGKLFRQLDAELDDCPQCHALIETDLYVSQDTVVRPDIMVICHEPGPRVTQAPVIIFEVVSRQTARRDEIFKYHLYAEEGVRFYGLVYPDLKKVRLFHLQNGKYLKVDDFSLGNYRFPDLDCDISMDFSRIWK